MTLYLLSCELWRVQLVAASFAAFNHYSRISDILKLGWLPIRYNRDIDLSKLYTFVKALYDEDWPSYL